MYVAGIFLTPNRAETVMNGTKPLPHSTIPRSMEPRFVHDFKLTGPLNNRSNGFWHRTMMQTAVRCGFDGIPTVRFSAVFRHRKTYGAVRCGFPISSNLWCGAVLCGFQEGRNPTGRCGAVRCGAVNRTEPIGKTAP